MIIKTFYLLNNLNKILFFVYYYLIKILLGKTLDIFVIKLWYIFLDKNKIIFFKKGNIYNI